MLHLFIKPLVKCMVFLVHYYFYRFFLMDSFAVARPFNCKQYGSIVPSEFKRVLLTVRPGSSVGIAADYGLDGPGIKSLWG
jgi:hypothetical protein